MIQIKVIKKIQVRMYNKSRRYSRFCKGEITSKAGVLVEIMVVLDPDVLTSTIQYNFTHIFKRLNQHMLIRRRINYD